MRLHPNRNTRSDWLERQFFFFSGTRQSLPQQGFGDFQTACLERRTQGTGEEQIGTLGGDQNQPPFLGQMIKGQRSK